MRERAEDVVAIATKVRLLCARMSKTKPTHDGAEDNLLTTFALSPSSESLSSFSASVLLRTGCKVGPVSQQKARNLYEPTENTHYISPPCYLPLYRFVSFLQSPLLHLKNLD